MLIVRKVRIILFSLAVLLLTYSSGEAANYPHYEIEANLDVQAHTISARQEVKFRNNYDQDLEELYFHIYPNKKFSKKEKDSIYKFAGYFKVNPFPDGFQEGSLDIDYIKLDDNDLSFSLEGEDKTILKVNLPFALKKGKTVHLKIGFDVSIPHAYGRFGWHKEIISLHRWYPILSVFDDKGWHNYPSYLFHQPYFSDASTYKLTLTVPENIVIAHSGLLFSQTRQDAGLKTVTLETENPTRDFSLALSRKYKLITKNCVDIRVKSFYLPGDEYYAQKAADFACDCLDYYSRSFGEYPYSEFSIAPTFLASGGYETSNLIFVDTRVYKLPKFLIRYFDFLISHETGHQWWFNVVGSDEYLQTWLDEGLNSYCLLNYLESKYGFGANVLQMPKFLSWLLPNFSFRDSSIFRYIYIAKNGLDRPILGSLSGFKEPSSIFALTYGKGAQVFSMLRYLIGNDAFSNLLRRYYERFKFGNASVEALKEMAQDLSAKDLDNFFYQWLQTDEFCDFAIKGVNDNQLVIENKGSIFMPLEVEVSFQDGQVIRKRLNFDKNELRIEFDKKIKSVRLDPDNHILETDKANNNFPAKFSKKIVPLYFFLYDMPLFMERDAYNITSGPILVSSGAGLKLSLQRPYDWTMSLSNSYDSSDENFRTTLDVLQNHLSGEQMDLGLSFSYNNYQDGRDDLREGKIFLRRQLWPVAYGLLDSNDHVTVYLLRSQEWRSSDLAGGKADNIYYRKSEEAIAGVTVHFARRGPYPDFSRGFSLDSTFESAGHFLGGKEAFWRTMQELALYKPLKNEAALAVRIKFGWGWPQDKRLFQLGGTDGLRGYPNKTVEGSRGILANFEYRLFLLNDLDIAFLDNIISLDDIQVVAFFDLGQAWNKSFSKRSLRKNAGVGLRFHLNIASFFERIILRLDVARAINDSDQDTRVWLGVSQTF